MVFFQPFSKVQFGQLYCKLSFTVTFSIVGLVGGLDPYLGQALMYLHALIGEWTGHSLELAQHIVDKGLLMEHIDELCKLKASTKVQHIFLQTVHATIYVPVCLFIVVLLMYGMS